MPHRTIRQLAAICTAFVLLCLIILAVFHWILTLLALLVVILIWQMLRLLKPQWFAAFRREARKDKEVKIISKQNFERLIEDVFIPSIVLVSINASRPIRILISKYHFVIGRSKVCDYILPDKNTIGRQHCCLEYSKENNQYFIQDLGSVNGTFVNGFQLPPCAPMLLNRNDIVAISRYQFRVESSSYQ